VLTTILDLFGVFLLVAFAFLVWPPLALLVAGSLALVASWRLSASPGARRPRKRREGAS
jgi:hypothetical protein